MQYLRDFITVLIMCGLFSCWRVMRHSLKDMLRTHCGYTWWQCILIHPQAYGRVFVNRFYQLIKWSLPILTLIYLGVLAWLVASL